LVTDITSVAEKCELRNEPIFKLAADSLMQAAEALKSIVADFASNESKSPFEKYLLAVPLIQFVGVVMGAWMMARAALCCAGHGSDNDDFYNRKIGNVGFYLAYELLPSLAILSALNNASGIAMYAEEAARI